MNMALLRSGQQYASQIMMLKVAGLRGHTPPRALSEIMLKVTGLVLRGLMLKVAGLRS